LKLKKTQPSAVSTTHVARQGELGASLQQMENKARRNNANSRPGQWKSSNNIGQLRWRDRLRTHLAERLVEASLGEVLRAEWPQAELQTKSKECGEGSVDTKPLRSAPSRS
jgi:hypothetical protein